MNTPLQKQAVPHRPCLSPPLSWDSLMASYPPQTQLSPGQGHPHGLPIAHPTLTAYTIPLPKPYCAPQAFIPPHTPLGPFRATHPPAPPQLPQTTLGHQGLPQDLTSPSPSTALVLVVYMRPSPNLKGPLTAITFTS